MRLGGNLLAGVVSSVWAAILVLGAVPFYIRYLGIEAYGLIGFFVTIQSLLQLLDLGLAPAMNREAARGLAAGNLDNARTLLHTLAFIYWGMSGLIMLLALPAAHFASNFWLQTSELPPETVGQAVMMMGLVIACRWPAGLYLNALMGAQRLAVASAVNMATVTLGTLGAVAVLAWVSPTIQAFFLWQATVGLAHAIAARWAAWRVLKRPSRPRFDAKDLRRIWRFSVGMSGITVSSLILMQLDKLILSKVLDLGDFGRYTLAWLVAGGLYVLLTPVFNTIYPHMAVLVTKQDPRQLTEFYRCGTRTLLAVLFPIAGAAAVAAEDLIHLWTGNVELASSAAPMASLLLIGTALNGAMHFPYALQLACGNTRIPLLITLLLIVILAPSTIVLATSLGAVGGALAWLILNCVYVAIGTWLTHRQLLKDIGVSWLLRDVGGPFLLSGATVLGGWTLWHTSDNPYANAALSGALALGAWFLTMLILNPSAMLVLWRYVRIQR